MKFEVGTRFAASVSFFVVESQILILEPKFSRFPKMKKME